MRRVMVVGGVRATAAMAWQGRAPAGGGFGFHARGLWACRLRFIVRLEGQVAPLRGGVWRIATPGVAIGARQGLIFARLIASGFLGRDWPSRAEHSVGSDSAEARAA